MNKCFIFLLAFFPVLLFAQEEDSEILKTIKQNQVLSFGGCDLIKVNDTSYLAGVAAVETGKKRISTLIRIGKVKAEREISTFINGSDITSSTTSFFKEELITENDSSYVKTVDKFVEKIREDSEGFVKTMLPAGFWYSEDRSVFFYAIYKQVNQ